MKKCVSVTCSLFIALSCFSQNIDVSILKEINVERNRRFDGTFLAISNTTAPVSVIYPVGMIATGLIRHDKQLTNEGIVDGASFIAATVLSTSLKYAFNRPRPYTTYPFIQNSINAAGPSFPSWHATAAFETATSLTFDFPKWYVIAPAWLWASGVAYARLDLGVHYPSDIMAGMILGAGSAIVGHKLQKWISKASDAKISRHKLALL